jgi:hypothetical protein
MIGLITTKQGFTCSLRSVDCLLQTAATSTALLQGEALSSQLIIKVIRVLGLSSGDKAVPTSWLDKLKSNNNDTPQGGVNIEINSPVDETVCLARCFAVSARLLVVYIVGIVQFGGILVP